jgi:hypothetical protein
MTRGAFVKRVAPIILTGAGSLVALDIIGALAGRPLGFPYSSLGGVSVLLYLLVGVFGSIRAGAGAGILAATAVGFLDATLGPLAAWMVGPGPVAQTVTEPRVFAYGIAVVTVSALAAGLVGALAAVWVERRRALRTSSSGISL